MIDGQMLFLNHFTLLLPVICLMLIRGSTDASLEAISS